MAIDAAIAQAFGAGLVPSTLRLYSWARPSFSIGRFQKLDPDLAAQLHNHDIPIVRRITGGRGVLHDHELTYSMVADTRDERFSGGLRGTFGTIARGLLAGLKTLGVAAEAPRLHAPDSTGRHGPFCFDRISGDEITVGGKKLIGSAQRRWAGHFIQHGSLILFHNPRAEPPDAPYPAALFDWLPPATTLVAIQAALVNAMAGTLSVQFEAGDLIDEEIADADSSALSPLGAGVPST